MGEMRKLMVIRPEEEGETPGERLSAVLSFALEGNDCEVIRRAEELRPLKNQRILFAVSLGDTGVNLEYQRMLRWMRQQKDAFEGCVAGVLMDSGSELYTKTTAKELVFTANQAGAAFVGRPLVEGTKSLKNFRVVAANMGVDIEEAYRLSAKILVKQILDFSYSPKERPNLLVLHASSHRTSNTYQLWNLVKKELDSFEITEIGLRNGTLFDCSGCPYSTCLHFGEQGSCFYGGVMVDDVYPAVKKADAVLLLCPNYNDALSANLTAFINRLTALFRTYRFYEKAVYALVVSGYSGSDIVAQQAISALNMNKTFYLPPYFAMMETANKAGEILTLPGIKERAREFGKRMTGILGRDDS